MSRGWGALVKWVPSFDDAGASPSPWGPAGGVGPAGPQGNAGPQGPAGPAGAAGAAGPAGLNWKGLWAAGTAYVLNDSVGRNGASWFATGAVAAGVDPNPSGDGHTAQAPWQLLAAQGATGPAGPQGPAGATGPAGPQGPAGGGGGSLTVQRNSLSANLALGAAGTTLVFSDNFAVGTWLIAFQFDIPAGGAVQQVWSTINLNTAVGTIHDPAESDGIQETSRGRSVQHVTTVDVTVAGTINFNLHTETNGTNALANLTGYNAIKVA